MEPNRTAEQARQILGGTLPDDVRATLQRLQALNEPQGVGQSPLFLPLVLLSTVGVMLGFVVAGAAYAKGLVAWAVAALIAATVIVVLAVVVLMRLRGQILEPVFAARKWIGRVIEGDLSARTESVAKGDCAALAHDLNALGAALGFLCVNLDRQTRRNLEQLEQKTRSLEILYDAAAGIDLLHDLDELLTRFLHTLMELAHARAGVVRLMGDDERMRLVAASGLSDAALQQTRVVPADKCMCGDQIADELLLQADLVACDPRVVSDFAGQTAMAMVTIPIRYADKTLGVYNLFLDDVAPVRRADITQLFGNIGRHLGIAIEKARLERHARRLSIIEERTLLANELHDSLAQTLASLRFQVSLVEETVGESRDRTGIRQIRMIKEGLDQANSQLRELLAHFRMRMDERGLVPAIEATVERFRKETGIAAFFQNELSEANLPPALEVQVLHIVQEALTNVRKHSNAQNVRVLLRGDSGGVYNVLVEDDGQGIEEKVIEDAPGEHIGLSIMRERAARLGGQISIESEPGEGTRVELQFQVSPQRRHREREEATVLSDGAAHE